MLGYGEGADRQEEGLAAKLAAKTIDTSRPGTPRPVQLPRPNPSFVGTSWRAEQGIWPTTVNRKVCGGNRSDMDAATQGPMMTLFAPRPSKASTQSTIRSTWPAPPDRSMAFFT